MKEKIEKIAEKADSVLVYIMRYVAVALIFIGLYVLYDNFHNEHDAFMSYDLLKYKPEASSGGGANDFAGIHDINKDTVAWLTVYDTHIDHPVVQGDDNFEYINKDVYGEFSLAGSIYLDSESDGFDGWYSVIFGHHMDNGAMFGDLDLFTEEEFFNSHTEGYLQTPECSYKLDLRAVIITDAYDDDIYHYTDNEGSREHMLEVIDKKAQYVRETGTQKLIALSTCNSGATFGRLVLIYGAEETKEPIKLTIIDTPKTSFLTAVGHINDSSHFALVNLVCMITSVLIVIGALFKRDKSTADHIAAVAAAIFCIAEIIVFFRTENIAKKAVFTDSYSLIMLVLVTAAYVIWVVLGRKQKNNNENNISEESEL